LLILYAGQPQILLLFWTIEDMWLVLAERNIVHAD
jgi:hypothetical protein